MSIYDPLSVHDHANPDGLLARARAECPVSRPYDDMYLVASAALVQEVLIDQKVYSARSNFVLDPHNGARVTMPVPAVTTLDPPRHGEVRAILRRWFAPRPLRELEPRVRSLVAALLDDLAGSEPVDLVVLAKALPARVVYTLVGIPDRDWAMVQEWTDAIHERLPFAFDDLDEFLNMSRYLVELIDERVRQADPSDDTVVGGLAAMVAEDQMSRDDVLTHVWQLITAGTATTSALIANLFYELLVDRTRWERLRSEPALVSTAVEESLRHDAPIQYVMRTPVGEATVGGCPVGHDQQIVLSLQSSNWDESEWGEDSSQFSLDRERPARHVAFGKGAHACLGAPIARMEATVLLEQMLERFPDLRLVDGFVREPVGELMVRRPEALWVLPGAEARS